MLTIDVCGYDGPDGGSGPYVWLQRFAPEMRSRGHDVRVRLFTWTDPEEGTVFRSLRDQGFDIDAARFGDTRANVKWLLSKTADSPPHVFVANHVVPAYHAARYIRRQGIPTVGVLRSDDRFYRALAEEFVFGSSARCVSAVVCVSEFLRDSIMERHPKGVEVTQIASGSPVPEERVATPGDIFRIVYVGRFAEEQKQISEVARALLRVTGEVDGTEALMVGDGPDHEAVETLLAAAGSDAVRCVGPLSSPEVQGLMLSSHAIVLLSDYEGTPMALMEAMACGCVPVCLRTRSGIPELIHHGVTGLLVDDRGDGVVAAIRRLRTDTALWERLSHAARYRIEDRYSVRHVADRWEDLLECLRARSTSPRAFRVPRRIVLHRPHPDLKHQDPRLPSLWRRGLRRAQRVRFHAGRVKRHLLGQALP